MVCPLGPPPRPGEWLLPPTSCLMLDHMFMRLLLLLLLGAEQGGDTLPPPPAPPPPPSTRSLARLPGRRYPEIQSMAADLVRRGGLQNKTLPGFTSHCNENPIYVFLFWALPGLSPSFHIFMCLWAIYILYSQDRIFCSRKGRSILGIYKSLTDT